MNERMKRCLLSLALLGSIAVHAEPGTRLRFDSSMEGVDNGGRFGAEVACSRPVVDAGRSSIVAIAAPNAIGGQGRVYLFDPVRPAAPIQVISPGSEQTAGRFGTAIQFIDDINGDLIDDLVVGAPGTPNASDGGVYLFTSAISQVGLRYAACAMMQGPQGFGASLQALRAAGGQSSAHVVVSNPRLARTDGFAVSAQSNGSCQFVPMSDFSESMVAGSGFGASITQVGPATGPVGDIARVFISASGEGDLGTVYESSAADSGFLPSEATLAAATTRPGLIVSGRFDSATYVIGSPRSDSSRGSVAVYNTLDDLNAGPRCAVPNTQLDNTGQFGSSLQHLGRSFLSMFSSAQEVIALRTSESSTGGALGLLGISAVGCTDVLLVNNCRQDPQQEQGAELTGGSDCLAFINGRVQPLIISGSPGWAEQRGRVDIASDEGILENTVSCAAITSVIPMAVSQVNEAGVGIEIPGGVVLMPTATEIPAVTATPPAEASPTVSVVPTLSETPAVSTSPTGIATPGSVETPIPGDRLDQSPESTPTPLPMPTVSIPENKGELPSGEGSRQAGSNPNQTDAPWGRQPIVVAPGSGGLPAPSLVVRPGVVQVEMPQVQPQLTLQQQNRMIRQLQMQSRISRNKATHMLNDPNNIEVTYIVRYWEVSSPRRFALIQSAHAQDSSGRGRKIKQVRTRSNKITLRNLRPGAVFGLSYSVELSTKKPRSRLGVTQASPTVTFRVD
jgi:hypothetical protein